MKSLWSYVGFADTIEKLGIERRLLTAGEHKGFLDPFLPVREDEVVHAKELLEDIHRQFIERVRKGRGDRLVAGDEVFSGLVWTGEQGLAMDLVDELASSGKVARESIGAEKIKDFTSKPDYFERLAERFGTAMGRGIASRVGDAGSIRLE